MSVRVRLDAGFEKALPVGISEEEAVGSEDVVIGTLRLRVLGMMLGVGKH
jgi:hypothetical protein